TSFLTSAGTIENIALQSTYKPRLMIGGTHFWGHADFYIAIPIGFPMLEERGQQIQYLRGVETAFKYYPWRITKDKIRPFIGFSIAPFYFEQSSDLLEFGNGPELNHTGFPLLSGFTFQRNNSLLELGLAWNYRNQQEYFIDRTTKATIDTPPLYLTFSFRKIIDTTLSAEKNWESGRTKEVTEQLGKKLNAFYFGAGLSSAFWLGSSSYNQQQRPYVEDYGISIMPDFTLGYYLSKPDLNFAIGYRGYGTSTTTYGTAQSLRRRSFVAEITKYLFDYNGFVPFIGPAISYDQLRFSESNQRQPTFDVTESQVAYGVTFGWDIRPNKLQSFILRTNLRWYPNLKLDVSQDGSANFSNIEFNFIQLILYPDRMF
ncbi:MAG: hypothetical protein AAFO69_18250, partial [Bacteroidota bacterium]